MLPNISRSKGKQTKKLDQLIEYNMRNIFAEYNTQNALKKLFPEFYLKKRNWAYLWIGSAKFQTVCFCRILIWGLSKHSEIKQQTPYFYLM